MENNALVQVLQYGGISAFAIFLMYKIVSNGLETQRRELVELRTEISKLRDSIERLITKLDEVMRR